MRTRNSLEHLAAVSPAEPSIDPGEQERILQRIFTVDRAVVRRRPPVALVLVTAAVVGAAIVAVVVARGHANAPVVQAGGGHHVVLSGARIQMAGYHFQTPPGFMASSSSCATESSSSGPHALSNPAPVTVTNGFKAAASADGGCVETFFLIPGSPTAPTPTPTGDPVAVGSYQGYYDAHNGSGSMLYVELPPASAGGAATIILALYGQGLTEDQLIAVAQSGLPAN